MVKVIHKKKKRTKKRKITATATVTSLMSQRIYPWVTFTNESTGGHEKGVGKPSTEALYYLFI